MKLGLTLILLLLPVLQAQNYEPLTGEERFRWFAKTTYGPKSLLVAGPFSAGWRTATNRPEEWGPGWEGFGKRYGARLVNNSMQNGTEAAAAHQPQVESVVHTMLLNRGCLIAPFHNMMLVSPATKKRQIDRLIAAFDEALTELFG